ncbi:hypothetical protein SCHPADRAFT_903136 [Schizopora paradoxa]|uniref:Cryptic loci regulator 2 N-terminal domain-containing protein n=1 Tax=Schizopora paradoxa TaxID=27342 RepID=A0A0H2RYN5_9AGAM|nr:hypothetical protein SCHPADRAFT_903136 [Schizopora paradoxa]
MELLPNVTPGTQFTLDEFPKNYKLYVHLKGDKDHPRKDYYLIGSQWVRKFRSPEEFVFHAKWLAFNGPLDVRGRPACACKYCGGSDQTEIGNYLDKKVGYSASHHGPFKPTRRRNSVEEKPILFKDYTRLRETAQDIKPGLHVIKDEEF